MIAYISGPYRAKTPNEVYDNIERARQVAVKYWKKGYAVICPHLNSFFMDGIIPTDDWLTRDCEIVSKCDLLVVLPNWHLSEGTMREIQEAKRLGLKIIYE